MESVNIKLEAFEGPIELLYHLIEKNKIDIYDIPIALLTDQYLEVLEAKENRNMDNISEFLVMAATLMEIKSKLLLPKVPEKDDEEEEEDPRTKLVERLLMYKRFKNISNELKIRQEKAACVLYKEGEIPKEVLVHTEPYDVSEVLSGIKIEDIYNAFMEVISRKENKIDRVRSTFKSVERDLFTIDEKMAYITDLLVLSPKIRFFDMFREGSAKNEKIVTFLALLELIKMKKITFTQDKLFNEITVSLYKEEEGKNEII